LSTWGQRRQQGRRYLFATNPKAELGGNLALVIPAAVATRIAPIDGAERRLATKKRLPARGNYR
jgi:hypothetical protein